MQDESARGKVAEDLESDPLSEHVGDIVQDYDGSMAQEPVGEQVEASLGEQWEQPKGEDYVQHSSRGSPQADGYVRHVRSEPELGLSPLGLQEEVLRWHCSSCSLMASRAMRCFSALRSLQPRPQRSYEPYQQDDLQPPFWPWQLLPVPCPLFQIVSIALDALGQ